MFFAGIANGTRNVPSARIANPFLRSDCGSEAAKEKESETQRATKRNKKSRERRGKEAEIRSLIVRDRPQNSAVETTRALRTALVTAAVIANTNTFKQIIASECDNVLLTQIQSFRC